jgi:hypothetical protein
MGGAYSMHRRKEKFMHGFGGVNLKIIDNLEDLIVDVKDILKYVA